MTRWPFAKGLHDLGNGCFAYLQPDGSWGWSNAGLIADSRRDPAGRHALRPQADPRDADHDAPRSAGRAGHRRLVNTHSNADHTFGNQLVEGAQIIASTRCYDEMVQVDVDARREELKNWRRSAMPASSCTRDLGGKFDFTTS